jgi:hypothetical protein
VRVARWPWRWRWAAVVAGTAVLCAVPGIVAALPVPGSAITAAALRARILDSAVVPYQGYVESTADLGLPQLPDLQDVSALADGVSEQYAWYRGPGEWRADTVTAAGENDVYQVGQTTYLWNQSLNLLTQVVGTEPIRLPRASDLLPPSLARSLLGLASPTDRLTRLPMRRVAGVDAAGLALHPASAATTVSTVDIWADPRSGLPVAVRVYARGDGKPILVSDFLQVSQRSPALTTVVPQPAPGVDQTTASLGSLNHILNNGRRHPWPRQLGGQDFDPVADGGLNAIAFYGSGFARFALVSLPEKVGRQAVAAVTSAGASALTVTGGSEVVAVTPLLTVVLATFDGFGGITFLLAGTETSKALEAAATSLLSLLASFAGHGPRRHR